METSAIHKLDNSLALFDCVAPTMLILDNRRNQLRPGLELSQPHRSLIWRMLSRRACLSASTLCQKNQSL